MTEPYRRGFTLMELLIVLAIIIMVISVGTPSVVQILDRSKFRSGVLELQAELGRTRSQAMKSGALLVFRYRSGTNEYQIIPKNAADFSSDEQIFPVKLLPENTLFMGGTTIEAESFLLPKTRDKEAEFQSDGKAVGTLSNNPITQFENTNITASPSDNVFQSVETATQNKNDSGWSKPILFFPNGKTSTAVIFLRSQPERGKRDYYSEISFRGITGAARISTISTYPPGTPEFPSVLTPKGFQQMMVPKADRFGGFKEGI